jgi:hypothetical protein
MAPKRCRIEEMRGTGRIDASLLKALKGQGRYGARKLFLDLVESGPYAGDEFFEVFSFQFCKKSQRSVGSKELPDNFH